MLHGSGPFRIVVTLLVAIALPFCCCDLRSLLGDCCQDHAQSPESDGSAHPRHCHGDAELTEHQSGESAPKAPAPCAPDKQHDCKCGKSDGKMPLSEKSPVEKSAPVDVALMESGPGVLMMPVAVRQSSVTLESGTLKPATALLRLHCALIV